MKVAVQPSPTEIEAMPMALRRRLADYLELTKPRIAVMVLITVAAGYLLAAGSNASAATLIHTLIGTGLVAAGASVWNQYLERRTDSLMRRTANRPLPTGRLMPLEVAVLGTAMAVVGCNYLLHALPTPWAALAAGLTFVSYVLVYTPLKRVTTYNTIIGALPGALPPVIGWLAATSEFHWGAMTAFLVLFFWQLPHFMAIAWMYRVDYAQAGHKMLPTVDPTGRLTSRSMILWCLVLIASSLVPVFVSPIDVLYLVGTVLLGVYFLRSTLKFNRDRTERQARQVLKASIFYLPGMMALLLVHVLVTAR
jgi:heme o synthase